MVYFPSTKDDLNLTFRPVGAGEEKPACVVKVSCSEQHLIEAIQKLLEEQPRLYERENAGLARIHFGRHLYQPLLVEMSDKAQMVPPRLNECEAQFVLDLCDDGNAEKDKALAGREVFLLRNLSRGNGIGFFEERGFYTDFFRGSWRQKHIESSLSNRMGCFTQKPTFTMRKHLHERLPQLAEEIEKRCSFHNVQNVLLDAFIISAIEYDDLYQRCDDDR